MNRKLIGGFTAATLIALAPFALRAAEQTVDATRSTASDTVHRASKITGMTVKNNDNKELGHVEDIVMDVKSGKVHYLAVSYGGLLGVGDKLFAVPVDVFQVNRAEDEGQFFLTLGVDEETLKSAPGFNQDKWPSFADNSWNQKVNQHYQKYRRTNRTTDDDGIQIRAGDTSVSVDIDRDRDRIRSRERDTERTATASAGNTIHRASEIIGMQVNGESNKELGEVNDVVVDMKNGKVKYLALSYGGVLGVGDKLFAVPFNAFDCRQGEDEDEYFLVVNIAEETLKNAPGFDEDNWPNFADSRWDDNLRKHYGDSNRRAQREQRDRSDR